MLNNILNLIGVSQHVHCNILGQLVLCAEELSCALQELL
jgi:hypothetical protein